MTAQVSATMPDSIKGFVLTILQALGAKADNAVVDDSRFRLTLDCPDGHSIHAQLMRMGIGGQAQLEGTISPTALVAAIAGGSLDVDLSTNVNALVGSFADVTVPALDSGGDPVPTNATLLAAISVAAGTAKPLGVERRSATKIRAYSLGKGFPSILGGDVEVATLVAGTLDVTMVGAVTAGDYFAVVELTAGGSAANHFSAFRKSATEITVIAESSAGAKVAGNTSVIMVINFSQSVEPTNRALATLVAGTLDVTLPGGVAAGDLLVVEEVTAAGTAASHYSAFRKNSTQATIFAQTSSGAKQSGSTSIVCVKNLGQPTVSGHTLASGTKDVLLGNAVGDQLAVILRESGGTPGVLSVKRKSATEVTVQSWLGGVGLQVLDTSKITVFNFGQPAHETSDVKWVVLRP